MASPQKRDFKCPLRMLTMALLASGVACGRKTSDKFMTSATDIETTSAGKATKTKPATLHWSKLHQTLTNTKNAAPAAHACTTKCTKKSVVPCHKSRPLAWANKKAEYPALATPSTTAHQPMTAGTLCRKTPQTSHTIARL